LCIAIFRPSNPDNLWFFARISGEGAKFILGIDFEIDLLHDFEKDRPAIIIANHQNTFDIFMFAYLKPRYTVSLGKIELLWVPLFGIFYYLTGNILVNRKNHQKALSSMKKVANTIKNKKLNIIIMPEGTRSNGKGLQPFKKGAFFTAINSGFPIVPICFSSWHKNINLNKWKAGTVKVSSLTKISTAGLSFSNIQHLMDSTYDKMSNEIKSLDHSLSISKN